MLHYLLGKPADQIAREIGISAGVVRARLSRARQGLAPMPEDIGALLAAATAEATPMITPRPAHLIRQRGDGRRRAEALRVLAALFVLAVFGSAAFALSAGIGP